MKLSLSDARSTIGRVIGDCSTSSRVVDYINEATRRLLHEGKWVGTYGKFRICTTGNESDSIITWPRWLETIETFSVCNHPGTIRNEWYEYLGSGPGPLDSERNIGNQLVDRGEAATTSDIVASGNQKKIRVVSDVAESGSATIRIFGEDWDGNRIYSSGILGESIAVNTIGTLSTNTFSKITGVQKLASNGVVRLYEYDTGDASVRQMAYYEPDETTPWYRRSIIPGLQDGTCEECSDTTQQQVEVMGKLRFIPVANNSDYILIGNLPALKLAVMAIRKEEADLIVEANAYMYGGPINGVNVIGAVPLLQKELSHWLGDGAVPVMRVQDPMTFGAGGVENVM